MDMLSLHVCTLCGTVWQDRSDGQQTLYHDGLETCCNGRL